MNNKKIMSRGRGRERRGVAVIVGGVILVAILLSTIFGLYFTLLSNDKAKSSYEIQSQQQSKEKGIETFIVDRDQTISGGSVNVNINNTGSIPMVASHALTYCSAGASCTNTGVPIHDLSISTVLNAGETKPVTVGNALMTAGNTYTISVISERGNIISSTTCTLQAGDTCSEDSGGDGTECVTCAVTEGIIQGTGSLQLDFKAFGALYPQLGSRAGVDQRGWEVVVSSDYGNATGYPGFDIQTIQNAGTQVVLVEKARNLDSSTEDLVLTRTTGLLTSTDQVSGTPPSSNYICHADKANKQLYEYNEGANSVTIPSTPLDADLDEGWVELYFCTATASDGSGNQYASFWSPSNKFSKLNGLFLVARGIFENINAPYAQTLAYQAVTPAKGNNPDNPLILCLRDGTTDPSGACPALAIACDSSAAPCSAAGFTGLKYSATIAEMQAGVPMRVHINNNAGDFVAGDSFDVSLLYPDGNYTSITTFSIAGLNANKNSPVFTMPQTNSDGTQITCSDPGTDDYYTLVLTDNFDSDAEKYVYYMTWRVDC